jgi:hypothetical protein
MRRIAKLIGRTLANESEEEGEKGRVLADVRALAAEFPLYPDYVSERTAARG